MGCPCEVALYAESPIAARKGFRAVRAEVDRLDRKYSHYREDSALKRLERDAARPGGAAIDEETAALFHHADVQFTLSDGVFDITARPLTRLWDRATRIPSRQQRAAALSVVGWHRVRWDSARIRMPRGFSLDLGGIVKEYAADRAALLLKRQGIEHGFVDLGGDFHFLGPHPCGSPWVVGIRDPERRNAPVATVTVRRGGLASSGDYERYSEIEGRRYGHLVDPRTGWPIETSDAEALRAVSVIAPTCLVAGSAATLALLLDAARARRLLDRGGLPWLAVRSDRQVLGTLRPERLSA